MRGNFLCFSLERNCGLDIWSSNLENSYIFQGACHNSESLDSQQKWVGGKAVFCLLFVFFFLSPLVWGSDTQCFLMLFETLPLKPWKERNLLLYYEPGIVQDTLLGFWRELMTDTLWQTQKSSGVWTTNQIHEQKLQWLLYVFIVTSQFQNRLCKYSIFNTSWENCLLGIIEEKCAR